MLTSRYPYQSGYTAWTGSCDDADPEGSVPVEGPPPATSPYISVMDAVNGGKYHPGATRGATITALPVPYTNLGSVDMADVQVQVLSAAGKPVSTAVTMTHVPWDPSVSAVAFPGCSAGESYALGTTSATGTLKVDTPWGYWDFNTGVVGGTPTRVWLHPSASEIDVVVRVP